jgi:hypothetical protein
LSQVVRVEEEPKGIDDTRTLVNNDEHCWRIRVAILVRLVSIGSDRLLLRTAVLLKLAVPGVINPVKRVRLVDIVPSCGFSELRVLLGVARRRVVVIVVALFLIREWLGDVVMAVQPVRAVFDVVVALKNNPASNLVQLVQVMESPLLGRVERFVVDLDSHVLDMLADVRGPELFARVKVNQRCVLHNIVGNVAKDPSAVVEVPLGVLTRNVLGLPRQRPTLQLTPFGLVLVVVFARGRIASEMV